jgi:hypothetical protein
MTESEHEHLRAALREARAEEPMPPAVAARLEDVLAGLAAERAAGGSGKRPVAVPLRRRTPAVLAAAAAVTLVLTGAWVGLARVVEGGGSSSYSSQAVGGSSGTKEGADAGRIPGPVAQAALPRLHRASFAADARRVLTEPRRDHLAAGGAPGCAGPGLAAVLGVQVLLDGRPAALLERPSRAGRTVAEAWSCDGRRRLAHASWPR